MKHSADVDMRGLARRGPLAERTPTGQSVRGPLFGHRQNRALVSVRVAQDLDDWRGALAGFDEVGVVFVDIDDVRVVNQRLGHDAGDRLLAEADRRLRALPADHIVRGGKGDLWWLAVTSAKADATVDERAKALAQSVVGCFDDDFLLPLSWHATARVAVMTAALDEAIFEVEMRLCFGKKRRVPFPLIDDDPPVEDSFGVGVVRSFLQRTAASMQESDPEGAFMLAEAAKAWPWNFPTSADIAGIDELVSSLLATDRIPDARRNRTGEIVRALRAAHERLALPPS